MTQLTSPVSIMPTLQRLDRWIAVAQAMCVEQSKKTHKTSSLLISESAEVAAAVSGDSDAYRKIMLRYQMMINQQMSRFSRDESVIEELVHDVFVEAFLSLPRFKGKSPLEHWLRKIAVRVGYKHWKAKAKDSERNRDLLNSHELRRRLTDPPIQPTEAADQLHDLLALLSDRDRLVLTLIYWDDCSVAEAARLTGWSQALVKVQAYRARKRLKKLWGKFDDETN